MDEIRHLLARLSEILPATDDKLLVLATPAIFQPENKKQLRDYCKFVKISNTNSKVVCNKLIPDLIIALDKYLHPEGVICHRQIERLKREGIKVVMVQLSGYNTPAALGIVTPMGKIYCRYDIDQLEIISDITYWGHPLNDFAQKYTTELQVNSSSGFKERIGEFA